MSIGGVVIAILIIRCLANRSGSGAPKVQSVGNSIVHQEISFRAVFLTVFYVSLYAFLIILFYDTLERTFFSGCRISWFDNIFLVFVSGFLPLILFRAVPPWLAWRVFRRLRLPFASRFFFWFTPGTFARDLDSFAALLRAERGFSPSPPAPDKGGFKEKVLRFFLLKRKPFPFRLDDWTLASSALAAEVRGDYDAAKQLLRGFYLCPPGMVASGILRRFAFEELAWQAAERGDWEQVGHRAALGCGMGMPLLRILSTAGLTGQVHRVVVWIAWLASPSRLRALPFVRAALKCRPAPDPVPCVPDTPVTGSGSRDLHLRLLSHAAEGTPVAMEDVFRLAHLWDGELDARGTEMLLRRGMELGARDVLGTSGRIREEVLDELEELASVADGRIPEEAADGREGDGDSCVDELVFRFRNRLYDDVSRAEERFEVEKGETFSDGEILEKWDAWLSLHEAASRLQHILGEDEMSFLWYGGLGTTAWNSTSRIFNATGQRTGWVAIIMFHWVAEMSGLLGDEESRASNINNMKICGYSEPSWWWRARRWMAGRARKAVRKVRGVKGSGVPGRVRDECKGNGQVHPS